MSFTPPQFTEPVSLDAERSWTATYDSYDQRNDDIYYRVIVAGGGGGELRLMAQVGMYWAGDDWTGPEFRERLRNELHKVALAGKSNTEYTGTPYKPGT